VSIAVVLPHSMFKQREYKKMIMQSALSLSAMNFVADFELSPFLEMVHPIPAPTEVLGRICDQFLGKRPKHFDRAGLADFYLIQFTKTEKNIPN
jgi:hypothetical protein